MKLLLSQRNQLFDTILGHGYPSEDFDFVKLPVQGALHDENSQIIYLPNSEYYFQIGRGDVSRGFIEYSPGESQLIASRKFAGWNDLYNSFTCWLMITLSLAASVVESCQRLITYRNVVGPVTPAFCILSFNAGAIANCFAFVVSSACNATTTVLLSLIPLPTTELCSPYDRRQLTNNGSNMTISIPASMSLAHDFLLLLNERMIRSL